jgi:SAM-dependent methyltransferase
MHEIPARTVSFTFAHRDRSSQNSDFTRCFSYPPRCGSDHTKPYHLDMAHSDIIDSLPSGSKILEIGCSVAHVRKYLLNKGHQYIGTDVSQGTDQRLSSSGPDVLCDAHFLSFRDRSFDVVYSAAVTEHLACPYLVAQEVARVLKPGGYYLGNVSFLEPWHADSFFHMSPLGVFETLSQAGFEILNIWPGKNYSGFRSLLSMGNFATKPLTFLGDIVYCIYRASNSFRDTVKRRKRNSIHDDARVAGAIDWIARLSPTGPQ